MSSTNFRLESFRAWNPPQARTRPLREPAGTCRYPSPVSITATPPPLNSNKPGVRRTEIDFHKSERHPLPSRPPVEACLEGLYLETPITRRESASLGRTPSTIHYPESANSEIVTQPQNIVDVDDLASIRSTDNIDQEADHQFLSFGWDDSELADFARQEPQAADSERHAQQTEQLLNIEAIDPAVLMSHDPPGTEQAQTTESIHATATYLEGCPATPSRSQSQASPPQRIRQKSKEMMGIECQSRTINSSGVRKMHTKRSSGRSNKTSGNRQSISFLKVCDQFSELSVEDRVQFLSWLFEGALSYCASTPLSAGAASPLRHLPSQCDGMTSDSEHRTLNTELVEMQYTSSRKGLPWSLQEDRLLVQLRDEQNLPWSEVAKQFSQKFPGRSKGSIQVYWSTSHKKR
ncbi:hypothetical protein N7466_001646 [Penicillium verhagenii]|uniref:uncharacterized protein n=1 Tax=Penicillium verhagenii TaxID=1562060 RepID=UPI002544E9E1|nr:uncharacterized protein N7466_001646 [Penicillium verhagenii]KAJ5938512.1 hypothetical protein N7466_001646 [Penicillium verhagenii]